MGHAWFLISTNCKLCVTGVQSVNLYNNGYDLSNYRGAPMNTRDTSYAAYGMRKYKLLFTNIRGIRSGLRVSKKLTD